MSIGGVAYRDVGNEREQGRGSVAYRDVGGTTPRMEEVERSRKPEPRTKQEQLPEDAGAMPRDFRYLLTPMCINYVMAASASRAPCGQPKMTSIRNDERKSALFFAGFFLQPVQLLAKLRRRIRA